MPGASRSTSAAAIRSAAIVIIIILLVGFVFGQVRNHRFIGLDDTRDIVANRAVRAGLTVEGLRWAFTNSNPPYRHPLTWISHMADVELFGLRPDGHLLMNVAFHLLTSILLFVTLARMTGGAWTSGLVAVFFAIHPLHVESVAWASERKDVLSAFFWMLALFSYLSYARRPAAGRYTLVFIWYALGLLAKPMVITLPAILLLLDVWPLARNRTRSLSRLILEKIPLLAAALPVAATTWILVRQTTFAARLFPLDLRIANALTALSTYLRQTVWPSGLAVFYPHPGSLGASIPLQRSGGALLLLAALTAAAIRLRKNRPWLLMGWLWFLVTLIPVLGIVQNWEQAHADRFTYLPLIGLFIALAGEAASRARGRVRRTAVLAVIAALLMLTSAIAARRQVAYWKDGETLFRRALAVTRDNWLASAQLGAVLLRQGRLAEAEDLLRRGIELRPLYPVAHNNLGVVLAKTGRTAEAAAEYQETIRQDPGYADAYVNLGTLRLREGKSEEAIALYHRALAIDGRHVAAHLNLGLSLEAQGKWAEAAIHYEAVLREEPENIGAQKRLGRVSRLADANSK